MNSFLKFLSSTQKNEKEMMSFAEIQRLEMLGYLNLFAK